MEMFYIEQDNNGWYLMPADPKHCPLLRELYGLEGESFAYLELPPTLEWKSLDEGKRLIRSVALQQGMTVQLCGNLKKRPTGILRKRVEAPDEPVMVFADLSGMDAAKWGVSDLYEEYEQALREAIASGNPFDTGWSSVKKEIQSFRVSRYRRNGPIKIEVSSCMDEDRDLVDTAFWKAAGGNDACDSGYDALQKRGLSETEIDETIDRVAEAMMLGEENCAYRDTLLHWRTGYAKVCESLDTLCDEAEGELNSIFEVTIAFCREELERLTK